MMFLEPNKKFAGDVTVATTPSYLRFWILCAMGRKGTGQGEKLRYRTAMAMLFNAEPKHFNYHTTIDELIRNFLKPQRLSA
jgi:hypothetical protein